MVYSCVWSGIYEPICLLMVWCGMMCGDVCVGTMVNGVPVVVGVMMRLEADISSQKYRLTARSSQPIVAQGMCAVWKALL